MKWAGNIIYSDFKAFQLNSLHKRVLLKKIQKTSTKTKNKQTRKAQQKPTKQKKPQNTNCPKNKTKRQKERANQDPGSIKPKTTEYS